MSAIRLQIQRLQKDLSNAYANSAELDFHDILRFLGDLLEIVDELDTAVTVLEERDYE